MRGQGLKHQWERRARGDAPCLQGVVGRVTPCAPGFVQYRTLIALSALFFVLGLGTSCRTLPLPPADFSAPGWRVLQGQAVWKPARDKAELAGELLLATNVNGNFFVQFGKIPFPLATAQASGGRWHIEFGSGDYQRSGKGRPPARFVWFQLPRALNGVEMSRHWRSEHWATNSWRLENLHTGETLETEFFESATSGKAEGLKQ